MNDNDATLIVLNFMKDMLINTKAIERAKEVGTLNEEDFQLVEKAKYRQLEIIQERINFYQRRRR